MGLIADSAELWNADRSEMLCEVANVNVSPSVKLGAECTFSSDTSLDSYVATFQPVLIAVEGREFQIKLKACGYSTGSFHASAFITKLL